MAKWSARTKRALFLGSLLLLGNAAHAEGKGEVKAIAVETNGQVLMYCKFAAFEDMKALVADLDAAQQPTAAPSKEPFTYTLRLLGPDIDSRRYVGKGVYNDGALTRQLTAAQFEAFSGLVLPRLRHANSKLADVKTIDQVTPGHWAGC